MSPELPHIAFFITLIFFPTQAVAVSVAFVTVCASHYRLFRNTYEPQCYVIEI